MAGSKLISKAEADRLEANGEAVAAHSPKHKAMMAELWEQVAKKFVYVGSLSKWIYKEKGTEKGHITDWAAQRIIDMQFATSLPVLHRGRADGRVRMEHESPQLVDVKNLFYQDQVEEHRSKPSFSKSDGLLKNLVVDFMDTHPGKPQIITVDRHRIFNLWSSPTVFPTGRDKYKEPRWFLDVVDRFFGEGQIEKDYFLDWCAHLVCHPEIKMPVSVLLTSSLNGAGKNFMAEALKYMVGERNYKNITSDAVKAGFQSFIPGTTLGVISELYEQGNYGFADKLKTWQSEDHQFINLKYGPQENVKNMVHFLAFSNRTTPLNLGPGDRRWFTFASPQTERASDEWWADKWEALRSRKRNNLPDKGKLGCLMRWFQLRMEDIERTNRFSPFRDPPLSEHKQGIIEDSRSAFFHRMKEAMEAGQIPLDLGRTVSKAEICSILVGLDPSFKEPANTSQFRADMEDLEFTYTRTDTARRWRAPDSYQAVSYPSLDI